MLFNTQRYHRALRFAAIVTLLMSLALAYQGGSNPVQAQGRVLEIGPIATMAMDDTGSGWAWTEPSGGTRGEPKLLRIAGNTYRAATINSPDAGQLVRNTDVLYDIDLVSQIGEGWAIGAGGGVRIWRLQGGVWRNYPHNLGRDVVLKDLAVSNDGRDGWITGTRSNLRGVLLRLRDGQWVEQAQTSGPELQYVAISPNGAHAWAVGQVPVPGGGSAIAVYQWLNGAWMIRNTFQGAPVVVAGQIAVNALTVDDNGNGWLLSPTTLHATRDAYITRLTNESLEQVAVDLPLTAAGGGNIISVYLHDAQVNAVGNGWITGAAQVAAQSGRPQTLPVLIRVVGSRFQEISTATLGIGPTLFDPTIVRLSPLAITPDGSHTWLASDLSAEFLSLLEISEAWVQAAPSVAVTLPGPGFCFQESRYCLRGAFARYWAANGGLRQFGFPITPEVTERLGNRTYTVQYTERARLEYHPENRPPNDVLLGLLGNALADPRLGENPFKPAAPNNSPGFRYFPQTGHNVGPPFLALWESRGGMPVFGLPRSEAFEEKSAIDGKTYLVQYFERNRLEYHPENVGTGYELLLGLLGLEHFQKTYGYKP
ncbi:MAG TPA: hypothetical protein VFH60_06380 [Chloroflexia bacterium]|nr:hypothetical protein [Chloroflexia bacterium]